MRKLVVTLGLVAATVAFSGSAFAQAAPAGGGATVAPPAGNTAGDDGKKISLGADLLFMLPVGDLADASGPQIGPALRGGYRVIPNLELTARLGYLLGLKKEIGSFGGQSVSTGFNLLPIWAGARYYFMEPGAGLYAGAEVGLNILMPTVDPEPPVKPDSRTRIGFNLLAGYVISRELPLNLGLQFSYYNLLLTEDVQTAAGKASETGAYAVGLNVGYSFNL